MPVIKKDFKLALALSLIVPSLPAQAQAFDWTSTDVQVLYGNDYELGVDERTIVTIEHADGWLYGSNFFFVDMTPQRTDIGFEVYAEANAYFSFSKISGQKLALGPMVNDISFFTGINIGNKPEGDNFKAYLVGLSFDLSNSLFKLLQLDISMYKADNVGGNYATQITPVWNLPFEIGPAKFRFRGFTDFRLGYPNQDGNFQIVSQPQFLFDLGDMLGISSNTLYIGTEYSYSLNKFGIKNLDESVVQGMAAVFF